MESATYRIKLVPYEETTLEERRKALQGTVEFESVKYLVFSTNRRGRIIEEGRNWDPRIVGILKSRSYHQIKRNPGSTITVKASLEEITRQFQSGGWDMTLEISPTELLSPPFAPVSWYERTD